jgi:hypothetical protein
MWSFHFRRAPFITATVVCLGAMQAQAQCPRVAPDRAALVGLGGPTLSAALTLARRDTWWTTPAVPFHVVWDRSASAGQDRLLHAAIAYHGAALAGQAWKWACVSDGLAGWFGAATGIAMSLPKEIGDGVHQDKGFSAPDFLWSTAGAVLAGVHRSIPPTRTVSLKVGYWPSNEYRARTSGEPRLFTDYAGQRYFLSFNPGRGSDASDRDHWPSWLGVAVGHGIPHWISQPPRHEWYVVVDFDFRGVAPEDGPLSFVAGLLDLVHFPAPGIKVSDGRLHVGLY